MEQKKIRQKLYCYVDETGQDVGSEFFVVVAVVSDRRQDLLRKQLLAVESIAKTGGRKWHKSRHKRRITYLKLVWAINASNPNSCIGLHDPRTCKKEL